MANYSNSQIRGRTTATVRGNFGRIILLKIARGTVVGFLWLLTFLLAPLKVGYTRGLIELVRGHRPKVNVVFSRFPQILACILLPIWTLIKQMLWLLPGLLIALLGSVMSVMATEEVIRIIGAVIDAAGLIVCFVHGIQAYYRYSMAHIAFADNPDLDVYDAVEYSKRMMEGRKFQLFCLSFTYLLYKLLVAIAVCAVGFIIYKLATELVSLAFLCGILIVVTAITAIGAFIYISLLEEMARICFYEENRI